MQTDQGRRCGFQVITEFMGSRRKAGNDDEKVLKLQRNDWAFSLDPDRFRSKRPER
jgi:hypothetical protein